MMTAHIGCNSSSHWHHTSFVAFQIKCDSSVGSTAFQTNKTQNVIARHYMAFCRWIHNTKGRLLTLFLGGNTMIKVKKKHCIIYLWYLPARYAVLVLISIGKIDHVYICFNLIFSWRSLSGPNFHYIGSAAVYSFAHHWFHYVSILKWE